MFREHTSPRYKSLLRMALAPEAKVLPAHLCANAAGATLVMTTTLQQTSLSRLLPFGVSPVLSGKRFFFKDCTLLAFVPIENAAILTEKVPFENRMDDLGKER